MIPAPGMLVRMPTRLLPLLLLAAGCQCCRGLSAADDAAIRERSLAWTAAANAGDHAALAALYTEDAALLPPNSPTVKGRAAVGDFMSKLPPISGMKLTPVEIKGARGLAYVWGDYVMTLTVPGAGAPVQDRGKYVEIWRRGEDGAWAIHRDIFNSDLPAAPGH